MLECAPKKNEDCGNPNPNRNGFFMIFLLCVKGRLTFIKQFCLSVVGISLACHRLVHCVVESVVEINKSLINRMIRLWGKPWQFLARIPLSTQGV